MMNKAKEQREMVAGGFNRTVFFAMLLISFSLSSACTYPTKINDRLSYAMEKHFVEQYKAAPSITFEIDKATKDYEFTDTASGFVGAAANRQFPIGWTFSAYLEQAEKAALRSSKELPINVGVHLSDCKLRYTNSGFGTGVDWIDISLLVDTTFPGYGTPRQISIRREVDMPMEETSLMGSNDRALVKAMEGLVADYLTTVVSEAKTIKERR